MKHKITTALCVLAIAIGSFATVQGYHRYESWRIEQKNKAAATLKSEVNQSVLKEAIFNAQVKQLENQCSKDTATYNALTAAQKAKTPAPQCTVNLVQ